MVSFSYDNVTYFFTHVTAMNSLHVLCAGAVVTWAAPVAACDYALIIATTGILEPTRGQWPCTSMSEVLLGTWHMGGAPWCQTCAPFPSRL